MFCYRSASAPLQKGLEGWRQVTIILSEKVHTVTHFQCLAVIDFGDVLSPCLSVMDILVMSFLLEQLQYPPPFIQLRCYESGHVSAINLFI